MRPMLMLGYRALSAYMMSCDGDISMHPKPHPIKHPYQNLNLILGAHSFNESKIYQNKAMEQ